MAEGLTPRLSSSIDGDAPKDFIHLYEYGTGRKAHRKTWPKYIAKVGHKWYPNESITEYFLTRLGQLIGLRIADSKLIIAHGQIRFLSKYFLSSQQRLIHGAEIFAGYLQDDHFVSQVEKANLAREFFTLQFVRDAIRNNFSQNWQELFADFIRMLSFDAIVGNNDRHHYNWGVIAHIKGTHREYFAPIYDTARALFWNDSEKRLRKAASTLTKSNSFLQGYIVGSRPKVGWDDDDDLNHFEIIERIQMDENFSKFHPILKEICNAFSIGDLNVLLNNEFSGLMSSVRRSLILECLKIRLTRFAKIVNN